MLSLLVSMSLWVTDLSKLTIPIVHAEEAEHVWTTDELKELATSIAKEHKLNVNHFLNVIEHESGWDVHARGDYPDGNGHFVPEARAPLGSKPSSFGLCQLHYPTRDWGIATSTADNPEACLTIMAEQWQKGNASKWSAWTLLYGASS